MEFTALEPVACPRCHANAGIPVAVAPHEGGPVIRFVCPVCHIVWDDQPEVGEAYAFTDEFILPEDRLSALERPPVSKLPAFRDHFR